MHVRGADAVHPADQSSADRCNEIGHAVSDRDRHRDDAPEPFGAEPVFGDPRSGRDCRQQRQREDRQRQHQSGPAQDAICADFVIGVANHRIDQDEARHRHRQQQRRGAFGRIPQHRNTACQHGQQEDRQRGRQRHGDDREHQHHHRLQRADDLQLIAQHAQGGAECRTREDPAEPGLVDHVLDHVDIDGGEERGEQHRQQPRYAGEGERPDAADRIGPYVEVGLVVGRPPAQPVEPRLEQRQGQRYRDQPGGDPERLVGIAVARARHPPGDSRHDQRDQPGEDQRLLPADTLDGEGQRQRTEDESGGERGPPRRHVGRVPVGQQVDGEPGDAQQDGERPGPQRPVGMGCGRVNGGCLGHAPSPGGRPIAPAGVPPGRRRPAAPSSAGGQRRAPGSRRGS